MGNMKNTIKKVQDKNYYQQQWSTWTRAMQLPGGKFSFLQTSQVKWLINFCYVIFLLQTRLC